MSTEDLNEVRTSLESSMDTKMSKLAETLTALILSLMNKDKPNVEVSEDADHLSETAQKAAADKKSAEEKLEKNKNAASSTSGNGNGEYSNVPPFLFADPRVNHPHINNVGNPPKVNAVDFERWQFEFRSYMRRSCNELWRIVEKGFNPQHDSDNYTNTEVVDAQLMPLPSI